MRLSPTLSVYIARQLIVWLGIMAFGLGCLVFLLSFVEQLRRASGQAGLAMELAIFQLPFLIQKVLPFIILFGSMMAFWRLSRSNELVAARAAGVSAWQFLLPAILVGVVVGGIQTTAFNPLASAMLARYEQVDAEYLRHTTSRLSVSPTGVWLRQGSEGGQTVINAQRIALDGAELLTVIFSSSKSRPVRQADRCGKRSAERRLLANPRSQLVHPRRPAQICRRIQNRHRPHPRQDRKQFRIARNIVLLGHSRIP